jgi:transcriptional regulator with XRE-family HTH domain
MSLRGMATLTGRGRGFLSRLERGRCGASEQTMRCVAAVLDVPVAAITREEMS